MDNSSSVNSGFVSVNYTDCSHISFIHSHISIFQRTTVEQSSVLIDEVLWSIRKSFSIKLGAIPILISVILNKSPIPRISPDFRYKVVILGIEKSFGSIII